jgi:hypothetical protein
MWIMRKIIVAAAVCFFALNCFSQAVPQATKNIDNMVTLINGDYDMGRIPAGKPLEYNVTIKNISKDTVIIKEVKAGCGCTTPKYRTNEAIPPGRSTFIVLGFNGDAHGEFTKIADIYFNDGSLTKQVKFHGVAVTDSTWKPAVQN